MSTNTDIKCTECGEQMDRGYLMGFSRVGWIPFPKNVKKFRIWLPRPEKVSAWACNQCGNIIFRLDKHK